jgi:hypothetical protein
MEPLSLLREGCALILSGIGVLYGVIQSWPSVDRAKVETLSLCVLPPYPVLFVFFPSVLPNTPH